MSEERRSDSGAYSQLEKEKALIKERLAKNEEEMAQVKDEQAPPRRARRRPIFEDLRNGRMVDSTIGQSTIRPIPAELRNGRMVDSTIGRSTIRPFPAELRNSRISTIGRSTI